MRLEIPVPAKVTAEICSKLPDIINGISSVEPFYLIAQEGNETNEHTIGHNQ